MLINISGSLYVAPDQIASVEGFFLTLTILIKLRDGTEHRQYVSESVLTAAQNYREARHMPYLSKEQLFDAQVSRFVTLINGGKFGRYPS